MFTIWEFSLKVVFLFFSFLVFIVFITLLINSLSGVTGDYMYNLKTRELFSRDDSLGIYLYIQPKSHIYVYIARAREMSS